MDLVKILSEQYMKPELPAMNVGDTVRVLVRVKEGNRERTQAFEGTIIAKKHGGINETITEAPSLPRSMAASMKPSPSAASPTVSAARRSSRFILPRLSPLPLSARVRFAVRSCTICVTVSARRQRSRSACKRCVSNGVFAQKTPFPYDGSEEN